MLTLEEQVEEARKLMNDIEFDMISKGRCYDEINSNIQYQIACEEWKKLRCQLLGKPKYFVADERYRKAYVARVKAYNAKKKRAKVSNNAIFHVWTAKKDYGNITTLQFIELLGVSKACFKGNYQDCLEIGGNSIHGYIFDLVEGDLGYTDRVRHRYTIYTLDKKVVKADISLKELVNMLNLSGGTIRASTRDEFDRAMVLNSNYKVVRLK